MFNLEFIVRKTAMLVSAGVFFLVAGCNSEGKNTSGTNGSIHADDTGESSPAKFGDTRVSAVYGHYLHVKDALVHSDSKEAQLGSAALRTALLQVNNAEGAKVAEKITKTADLSSQRATFNALTAQIEEIVRKSPISSGEVYKQYCPMANEGNGAYWLSSDRVIRNPYYGDEMLECGEVKEVLK